MELRGLATELKRAFPRTRSQFSQLLEASYYSRDVRHGQHPQLLQYIIHGNAVVPLLPNQTVQLMSADTHQTSYENRATEKRGAGCTQ